MAAQTRQYCCDRRCQCCLAMVHVTNRSNVYVWLLTLKLFFCHDDLGAGTQQRSAVITVWCSWAGSNCRPLPYQGSALPLSHMSNFLLKPGAGEGNRTLVLSLEGFSSTIELHPHTLHAPFQGRTRLNCLNSWWRELDSNQRRRKPTDLQSAPFSHSGISPKENPGLWMLF
jgi:hypothetical protein